MTLFNHLFGNKNSAAKEIIIDDNKRIELWNQHIKDFDLKESLCKHFNFANVDKALEDFETTKTILTQIEALTSPELVHIEDEEKNDEEVISDLDKLKSNSEIDTLNNIIVDTHQKYSHILELFLELYNVLNVELHLIKLIKQNPSKDLLLKLFKLIFHQEARLCKLFKEDNFYKDSKYIHEHIVKIGHAIIMQQKFEEELMTDEEKFAESVIKQMGQTESKNRYRELGEDIFFKLAEMVGAPLARTENIVDAIKRIENLMSDDKVMIEIVHKIRPSYDMATVGGIIIAFRKAYDLGHFIDLQSEALE